jgi:ubiquinone/menaquinone biosynthesis C-methylase UbiE
MAKRSLDSDAALDDPYDWDRRVEAWEQVAATDAFVALRDVVCDAAAVSGNERVLDLGAGGGLVTLELAPRVEHVTALDISPAMLDRLEVHAGEQNVENVTAVVADMRRLPFEDDSFDVVVSNYAFHHLVDAEKALALAETRRVLVPGGRLVVCDMMFSLSLQPRDRKLLAEKVLAIAKRGPAGLLRILRNAGRAVVGAWEHPASPEAWEEMLADRHFADIRVELLANEAGLAVARRPVARIAR